MFFHTTEEAVTHVNQCDVIIIGGGPGGYPLALQAAKSGASVTLIERDQFGGTCLNWGCIPTKALLASAQQFHRFRHAADYGLTADNIGYDWNAVLQRKATIVTKLRAGIEQMLKTAKVNVVRGDARVYADRHVEVTSAGWAGQADKVVIATGSSVAIPGMVPPDRKTFWSSDEALSAECVPETLLVIGGGVIGLEMGQMFADFGAKVTIVEMMPQILPGLDTAVAKRLLPVFKKSGLEIFVGTKVESLQATPAGAVAVFAGQERSFQRVLVATGRRPNRSCCEGTGIALELEGQAIKVDAAFQTSIQGIYALGDCTPGPMLAHRATYDAMVMAAQWRGEKITADYRHMPACVYTRPEISWFGLNEDAAREQQPPVRVGRSQFAANGKAMCAGEAEGQVKLLVSAEGRLVGGVLWGPETSNLISEGVALAATGVDLRQSLLHAVHPHPTLAEIMGETLGAATGIGGAHS